MTSDEALRTSAKSTAWPVEKAAAQLSGLMRDEIPLAETEMGAKARTMGGAAALLGHGAAAGAMCARPDLGPAGGRARRGERRRPPP